MCVTCSARYALFVVKTTFKRLPLSCANLYLSMHVFHMASYMLYVDYIHPYLAMLVGLQNIGGVWILVCVHLYSNAKVKLCTLLGGDHLYFGNFVAMLLFDISIVQIRVLSSNTKKGEIERAFPA